MIACMKQHASYHSRFHYMATCLNIRETMFNCHSTGNILMFQCIEVNCNFLFEVCVVITERHANCSKLPGI